MRELKRNVECCVSRDEALRYLGYSNQPLSSDLENRINDAILLCEQAARPTWVYRVFPLIKTEGALALEGAAITLPLGKTTLSLQAAHSCALMVCTLGLAFEQEATKLSATDTTQALIYDAAGSSLVESCADDCERAINAFAAQATLFAGQRISPGYGDFPLEVSDDILAALDAQKLLGVSMTESHLLIPSKSITACVGLFQDERDAAKAHRSCSDCVARNGCSYLKAGKPCYL